MAQEYWCCYYNYYEKTKRLNDEELGRLFRALMRYTATGELVEPDGPEILAFDFIMEDIRKANEVYADRCLTNRMNGAKAWEKRKNQTDANATERYQAEEKIANATERYPIKENKVKESKVKENNDTNTNAVLCEEPFSDIVEAWNKLPDPIPKIHKIRRGSTRQKLLSKRVSEYSAADVLQAIDNIYDSDFLQGNNNTAWTITFDWFIKPNNFQKVFDGNYKNQTKRKTETAHFHDELEEWKEDMRKNGFN